jgi:hypothetical protein
MDNVKPAPEPPQEPRAVAWATLAIAVALILLLLFNAASLRSWTAQQAPSPAALAARDLADRWWAITTQAGLNAPRAAIADLWKSARALDWRSPPARDGPDQR